VTFDIDKMLESKRAMRGRLAQLPIAEKLAMLDALRDRLLTIRKATMGPQTSVARESRPRYGVDEHED
jgi:hypothetical protein